ncbi:adhesive plaque matrix protein-like [Procambarus clarkii]|uniref:adhesive plaque matrix protein-like n=1 Tax=Procambarus clarkii TaxID=6728 RepID=UPI003742256F
MKLLVFVILAAAACASVIEKRDAEPSYGTSNYGSAYPPYSHRYHNGKRSAEPEPEPSSPIYSYDSRLGYGRNYNKRSAEPKPEPSYPVYYASRPVYIRHFYKRSAEPEPEPSYPVYYAPRHGYGPHFYKRSADPEPSYSVLSYYGYRPLNAYSHHLS